MIMIKDNHIDFAGSVEQAIERVHKYLKEKGLDIKIEIEVRNFDELDRVLKKGGIHRIMLDNFTPEDTEQAVRLINGRYEVESSGGITLENIRHYAQAGVDYISVGALTHQIHSLDMSLKKNI
jgi:nicotinate-nucleotide pyrophosphorylase (carboxylating)